MPLPYCGICCCQQFSCRGKCRWKKSRTLHIVIAMGSSCYYHCCCYFVRRENEGEIEIHFASNHSFAAQFEKEAVQVRCAVKYGPSNIIPNFFLWLLLSWQNDEELMALRQNSSKRKSTFHSFLLSHKLHIDNTNGVKCSAIHPIAYRISRKCILLWCIVSTRQTSVPTTKRVSLIGKQKEKAKRKNKDSRIEHLHSTTTSRSLVWRSNIILHWITGST